MPVWIGLDDTDSKNGGCTTYVGAVLLRRLASLGFRIRGFPRLVRLNPNCPFKTRGNAAVAIKIEGEEVELAKRVVGEVVEELAELDAEGTDPAAVLLDGEPGERLRRFYWRALHEVIPLDEGLRAADEVGAEVLRWKKGRGVIGALAAIGANLTSKTYELIAHRRREYWGTVRQIDPESVYRMDEATRPLTFDNIDHETGEVRITPHTPCPVLFGIRGTSPGAVVKAFGMVRVMEPIEMITIFETNQGTDAHILPMRINMLRDGTSAMVDGVVVEKPRFDIGGHLFFKINDGTGEITCAVYEPTRSLRHIASKLMPGDEITVYGAVKLKPQGMTLNIEKIHVSKIADIYVGRPPLCPSCKVRMKSLGNFKGYRCRRCGLRKGVEAVEVGRVKRGLRPGLYEVPPSARRHLSKPLLLERLRGDHKHRQSASNLVQPPCEGTST